MLSIMVKSPIRAPVRKWPTWGARLMLSWPPATTTSLSSFKIAWTPSATVRSPKPQTKLTLQAGTSTPRPALIEAWRAGFWPCPAVRIWPRITSETSSGATFARASDSLMTMVPRSCAGRDASAPPNDPTGVRAAPAMTISVMVCLSRLVRFHGPPPNLCTAQ